MTKIYDLERAKAASLSRFDIGKPADPDYGPLTECTEAENDGVCDAPNCRRDCAFVKALGWTEANAA